jgi:hypothetical protein
MRSAKSLLKKKKKKCSLAHYYSKSFLSLTPRAQKEAFILGHARSPRRCKHFLWKRGKVHERKREGEREREREREFDQQTEKMRERNESPATLRFLS